MKNMFLVINKEKVYAYVVSVCTIITLFFMSSIINSNIYETEETSSNADIFLNNNMNYNNNSYNNNIENIENQ